MYFAFKRFIIMVLFLWSLPLYSQSDQRVVSDWAALSGGLKGKVVFGRNDQIWIMDLVTGDTFPIANFPLANTIGGPSGSFKFSPDGSRIVAQNDQVLMVLNADGSGQRIIWQGSLPWDLICAGWDGDSAVVYSTFDKVVRTEIHSDNTAGGTTILIDTKPYYGYASVEKSGDYLCYLDIQGNVPTHGYHRTLMKNLATGVVREMVPRNISGCTIRLRPDGSGVCIQNKNNHLDPAYIQTFDTVTIDRLAPVPNMGIAGMRWSNRVEFLVHNGDRAAQVGNRADYAYIRKMTTPEKEYVFLGTRMYWPDLWVGEPSGQDICALPRILPAIRSFKDSVMVEITTDTPDAEIYYTLDGSTPTVLSLRYTGPFVLRTTALVKARAMKSGMIPSNVAEQYYLNAELRPPENPVNVIPKLKYSYYEGNWNALPNFDLLTPVDTGLVDSFDISISRRNDFFGIVFTGFISIVKDDIYTFLTGSDAGSKLYIGDSLVVRNDGLHSYREATGNIALGVGRHSIRVEYFEQTGSEALVVAYSGGGMVRKAIPGNVLYHVTAQKSIKILSPNGGEQYGFGDTIRLSWLFINGIGMAAVLVLSLDDGASFSVSLFGDSYVHETVEGNAFWVVPAEDSLITNEARIKVFMYNNEPVHDVSDGAFSIVAVNRMRDASSRSVKEKPAVFCRKTVLYGTLRSDVSTTEPFFIYSIDGKLRYVSAMMPQTYITLPPGVYIMSAGKSEER